MHRNIVFSLMAIASIGVVNAQTAPFELEKFKTQEVGLNSNNAALLNTVDFKNLGESSVFYKGASGAFKHPLVGEKSQYGGFQTARYQALKKWKFYGKFALDFGKDKEVSNTTQLNPLRLNPFIIVDSLSGDWNKQNYDIAVKIASPILADKFSFGLGLDYKVSTGARQRDPRPENTNNILTVKPGATYLIDQNSTIGINGLYQNFVEDFTVSNINTTTVHNMYKLIGVGEYIGSAPFFISTGGITRRYEGNKFGAGLQYVLSHDQWRFAADAFYNHNKENAIDGTTYPQQAGQHEYDEYGLNLEALWHANTIQHRLDIGWIQQNIDNTEFHQYQDVISKEYITLFSNVFNTNLVTNANLNYSFVKYKGNDLNWKWGANLAYAGWDNRYSVKESQQTVDRLTYGLNFKKYFNFANLSALSFAINPAYSQSIESTFAYDEKAYSTNFVANNILYPANDYLAANYFTIAANLQYVFKPSKNNTQVYIKVTENFIKPVENTDYFSKSQRRLDWQLSVGLLTF